MMFETTTTKQSLWEFKKYNEHEWFRFLVLLLLLMVAAYLISHTFVNDRACYEYEKLGKEQLQQINRIYFDTLKDTEQSADTVPGSDNDENGNTDNRLRSPDEDVNNNGNSLYDSSMCARALLYIQNAFNNKVDSIQLEDIKPYLCSARQVEAVEFLGDLRFRLKSYFWLVGPEVYFEIVFWAWFGVIASLLFSLGVIGRNVTTDFGNPQSVFDSSEIPYQFAKLLYAPLCTLVIVLGYNYFSDENIVDIGSSKGVIVFAFIGGFYSARLISFLDRLKEVLLPHSGTAEVQAQKPATTVMLTNVKMDLQLDETTIPAELRNDITEFGLSDASVTLENKENGEITQALKIEGDQTSAFTVESIKPGTYLIKASWSKEVNEQPVNLIAEQEEVIKNSDATINVVLKKDESEG